MSESTSRRGFLRDGRRDPPSRRRRRRPSGAEPPPLYDGEIVDTHLHLWDLNVLRPPWIEAATGRAERSWRVTTGSPTSPRPPGA